MKNIGLLLLAIGVAVSASFGARLAPDVKTELANANKVGVLKAAAGEAKAAYCAARLEQKLPHNANCPTAEEKKKAEEAKKAADAEAAKKKAEAKKAAKAAGKAAPPKAEKPAPNREKLLADAKAAYAKVEGGKDADATGAAAKAQTVWLTAEKALIEPTVTAAFVKPTDPSLRLSQWFSESGIPFLGGLLLVVIGAIIGRKAVRAEATGGGKKKGPEAVDFGTLIKSLKAEITELANGMGETPDAGQADAVKSRIEALQFEAFEPIVEARGRIQVRFGIADYAELFSPFSSAERRINRSWSALVDNHWPEARDSMRIAAGHLAETETILDRLLAKG